MVAAADGIKRLELDEVRDTNEHKALHLTRAAGGLMSRVHAASQLGAGVNPGYSGAQRQGGAAGGLPVGGGVGFSGVGLSGAQAAVEPVRRRGGGTAAPEDGTELV